MLPRKKLSLLKSRQYMNVVCQQCVERACEIIREPLSPRERKTVCSKLHSVIHADAKEDGINFQGE